VPIQRNWRVSNSMPGRCMACVAIMLVMIMWTVVPSLGAIAAM